VPSASVLSDHGTRDEAKQAPTSFSRAAADCMRTTPTLLACDIGRQKLAMTPLGGTTTIYLRSTAMAH
jgi:hypothetical protein